MGQKKIELNYSKGLYSGVFIITRLSKQSILKVYVLPDIFCLRAEPVFTRDLDRAFPFEHLINHWDC